MQKKYNLIVPLAGRANRMIEGGYSLPKPTIHAGSKRILDYSLESMDYSECNLIFVIRRDHICNFGIDKTLKHTYGDDITLVVAETDTDGSVSSCYLAKDYINNDLPLIVFCPDIYFEPKFVPTDDIFENDGFILTFKANSTNYSYVQLDENGFATRTAEKIVISEDASVGVYCFKTGKMFLDLVEVAIKNNLRTKNEFYICPLYNILIQNGGKVRAQQVPLMYIMGTPSEMKFFKDVIFPYFLPRSFILCSDHSGYNLKEKAKKILNELNISYIDTGCYSDEDCDYSDYIDQAVETKKYYPGAFILGFCRSGQGVNICLNKHKNIRSVLINNSKSAALGIQHNAANAFAIPESSTDELSLKEIIQILLVEKFCGGRFQNRLMKVVNNENNKDQ